MKRHYGIQGDGFTWKPNCHAHICVGLDEPRDGQVVQARKRGHEPDAGHGGRMSGHETWHKEGGDGQAASGTHGHHHHQTTQNCSDSGVYSKTLLIKSYFLHIREYLRRFHPTFCILSLKLRKEHGSTLLYSSEVRNAFYDYHHPSHGEWISYAEKYPLIPLKRTSSLTA